MKQLIKKTMQALLLVPMLALGASAVIAPPSALAVDGCDDYTLEGGVNCAASDDQKDASLFDADGVFQQVVNVLLFLIGAIAVIMLIIGGIRYVISGGDQAAVTSAKNTILYAIVGIIVAFLAYAIVEFVLTALADNS